MAHDTSGNNLHASLKGPTWTGGRYGPGLEFDGINDVLDAGDPGLLDVNQYTLMAWVKQDARGADRQQIIEESDAYWITIRNDTGELRSGGFYGGCSASNWKYFDSADIIPLGTWTHVATTYDGSQLKAFVNGEPSGTLSVIGNTCSNSNPLIIGAKNASTAVFDGVIDEVRIYSYALTPAEIVEAMNDSGEMPTPTPTPTATPKPYLANGSFEQGPGIPAPWWANRNLTPKDRRVCKTAHDGSCSFKMLGTTVKKSLRQVVSISGSVGDSFTLSGWSKASNPLRKGGPYCLQARVFHTDGTKENYRACFAKRTHDWQRRQRTFTTVKDYKKIVVYLLYARQSGKAWFDHVRLVLH